MASSSSTAAQTAPFILGINAGGGEITIGGNSYIADRFGSGTPNSTTDPIEGTDADAMYQSELYGETITYEIPVTNETYSVELHFVEMYNTAAGDRIFSADIEGSTVFTNLDLFAEAGHDFAYTVRADNIAVNDEKLTITLTRSEDNATISGISIYSVDGEFVEPPAPPPPPVSAENPGADCTVGNLPSGNSLPNNPNLPDPFTKLDGTRITDKSEWRCRRQETLKQAYNYLYGEKPPKPDSVSGSVSASRISVNVSHEGRDLSFSATVTTPSGSGPFPAVIAFSAAPEMSALFRQNGVAVINFNSADLAADTSSLTGPFFSLYQGQTNAGLLTAWSWGVSRLIDVIEANPGVINAQRLAVTGCSRLGKAAFVAGAFDGRIALTIPVESGVGGLSSLKLIPDLNGPGAGGEQPSHATTGYRPWFSPSAFTLVNQTDRLPVDTHQVVGLIAPRGLLVIDNHGRLTDWRGLNFESTYAATIAGKRIYQALGVEDAVTFVAEGQSHCQWNGAFSQPLTQNINRFLLGQNGNTGTVATDYGAINVDEWIDWTVPNLSGTLDLSVE
ncbi:MAG TPA: malectin domain-containing carbohydrate-binding protein [Marinagarivorans sp.]